MKKFGRISAAGLFRSIAVFLLGIVTVLALAFAVYGYEGRDYYYATGFDYLQLNELAGTQLICAIVCILLLAVGALAAVFAVIALLLKGKGARRLTDACGVLCVVFLCVYMVLGFVICGEQENDAGRCGAFVQHGAIYPVRDRRGAAGFVFCRRHPACIARKEEGAVRG